VTVDISEVDIAMNVAPKHARNICNIDTKPVLVALSPDHMMTNESTFSLKENQIVDFFNFVANAFVSPFQHTNNA
jgi:hypothetical protein